MSPDFGYGIVIDAGSSGSRIYLYRWPIVQRPRGTLASSRAPFAKVEQEAVFSEERMPGIDDKERGLALLEELISAAASALPAHVDRHDVPIHLGATAGMRIADSEAEADAMASVRSLLRASGFAFRDDWARTISGGEEGTYGWLAANYLQNGGEMPTSSTAYGALDLGGASTQISFLASTSEEEGRSDLWMDNVDYPLYSQSYLHYGVDQALMQYDEKIASATRSNPCYPRGYIDPNSGVSGSSNWEECLQSVAVFFDQTPNCNGQEEGPCLIGDLHHPSINDDQKFIAMSAFVYVWDYLGLKIGKETEDLSALDIRARRICNLTHKQQLTTRYQRQMENHSLKRRTNQPHMQCFSAAFSYHLLSKGYGMPISKTPIEIYYEINGTKVQWALGLMLVEANRLSSIFEKSSQYRHLDVTSMGNTYNYLIMISTAILITVVWTVWKQPCSGQEPCLPLGNPAALVQASTPRKGR